MLTVQLRRLEILLRQTEILYSLCKLSGGQKAENVVMGTATQDLSQARETLSWLLHHDAITGNVPRIRQVHVLLSQRCILLHGL